MVLCGYRRPRAEKEVGPKVGPVVMAVSPDGVKNGLMGLMGKPILWRACRLFWRADRTAIPPRVLTAETLGCRPRSS
jgi:hypothetical protein